MAGDLTLLLRAWQGGDEEAGERLLATLYPRLRRLAASRLRRGGSDLSLQPTEVLHEAYLELARLGQIEWHNRVQFFAIASRVMRQIVVGQARHRNRKKRGEGERPLSLATLADLAQPTVRDDVVALDEALSRLAADHHDAARVVELRYFGGLTLEEAAATLGLGRSTVVRSWRFARAWLRRELDAGEAAPRSHEARAR